MCVLVDLSVYAMRVSLRALLEPCDIPHGKKRQCNGEARSTREAEKRKNGKGSEPRELSVNFLKVLHLVSHYFH